MAEKSDQNQATKAIDLHGDVKLKLDDGSFQVSRKALCLSSPVFLAMFDESSQFWEASDKAVGKGQIRSIPLREDDFHTMEILLCIIHHQNQYVPKKVSFEQLNKIAVVCDKYDLRECLVAWSFLWSQPYIDCIEKDGFESWLFLSIVFWDQGAFTQVTKHLILNTILSPSGMLCSTSGKNLEKHIPDFIISQIKERRATAIEAIQELVRNLMLRLLYKKPQPVCTLQEKRAECDRSNLGCLLEKFPRFCDSSAKDANRDTISSTVAKIRHMPNHGSELTFKYLLDRRRVTNNHAGCGLDKILLPEVTAVVQSVQGLFLKNPSP